MLYDLRNTLGKERFKARANALFAKGAIVELSEKAARTKPQNSYIHLLIGLVAMETGVTIEYCKQEYFKRLVNPLLFRTAIQDRYAGEVEILRSSADLSKEEMSQAIDRFKQWAAEQGIFLPEPGDDALLKELEIEIEKQRRWL